MKPPRRADRTPASAARCTAVAAAAFPRSYVDVRPRARGRRARVRGLPGCGYYADTCSTLSLTCCIYVAPRIGRRCMSRTSSLDKSAFVTYLRYTKKLK
jgi:hypothetical protein